METQEKYSKLKPNLAPYKVNVLPLIKKNHSEKAMEIYQELSKYFPVSLR